MSRRSRRLAELPVEYNLMDNPERQLRGRRRRRAPVQVAVATPAAVVSPANATGNQEIGTRELEGGEAATNRDSQRRSSSHVSSASNSAHGKGSKSSPKTKPGKTSHNEITSLTGTGFVGSDDEPEKATAREEYCAELTKLLEESKENLQGDGLATLEGAPNVNEATGEDTIWRAIASVTEAISNNIGDDNVRFGLIDFVDFSLLHQLPDAGPDIVSSREMARPGSETFLVRTDGTQGRIHHSLYHLRKIGDHKFELASYDSARGDYHRANNQEIAEEFQKFLVDIFGWNDANKNLRIEKEVRSSDPPARQLGKLDCGIYVTLYAWALALGLDISGFQGVELNDKQRFIQTAVDIIRLALQGYCSSALIEAFLKCFGIVEPDAQIPTNREFDRTLAFLSEDSLRNHIATVRIQENIDSQGLDLPPVIELLEMISTVDARFMEQLWDKTVADMFVAYTEYNKKKESSSSNSSVPSVPSNGSSPSIRISNSPPSKRSIEASGEVSARKRSRN